MWKRLLLPALALVIALAGARTGGDYFEYFAMARAFVSHGSPAVREADIAWASAALSLPPGSFPLTGNVFRLALDGQHYPVHFWFYSLLVAPFLAVVGALRLAPGLAFALVNALGLSLALLYVQHLLRGRLRGIVAALVVLLSGATFYLGWAAPESLTGAAVLVACLAAPRGHLALGFLATGVAASQNPSAAALFGPVTLGWWRLRRAMSASFLPSGWRERAGVLAGVILAAAPYAFFWLKFHVPSLIARGAIDASLIGWPHLKSLIFDLDQGMINGFPGLMLAVPVAAVGVFGFGSRAAQQTARVSLGLLALAFAGLVPPVLGQSNWNSAAVVVMRYAFWTAMPLLALALELLPLLSRNWAVASFATIVTGQTAVFALNGVCGEKSNYVAHSPLGRFFLTHFPSAYDPLPEIFLERTKAEDQGISIDSRAYFPAPDWPTKILTHWSAPVVPCSWYPAGKQVVVPSSTTQTADGFLYLNGPFTCRPQGESVRSVWRTDQKHYDTPILREGWSRPEATGVWSDGARSKLRLPVPSGFTPAFIRFHGRYYAQRNTQVLVGGETLGNADLSDARLRLPSSLASGKSLEVELVHPDPRAPKEAGESTDVRRLAYLLQVVGLEWAD
jgi:hypothetical protein